MGSYLEYLRKRWNAKTIDTTEIKQKIDFKISFNENRILRLQNENETLQNFLIEVS